MGTGGEGKGKGMGGKEGRGWEEKGGEGREERRNVSMHPLGFSKVGAYEFMRPSYRPHYAYCPSVRLSVCRVRAPNSKRRRTIKFM